MIDVGSIFSEAERRKVSWETDQRKAQAIRSAKLSNAQQFLNTAGDEALRQIEAEILQQLRLYVLRGGTANEGDHNTLPRRATLTPSKNRHDFTPKYGTVGLSHDGENATAFYRFEGKDEVMGGTWEQGLAEATSKLLDAIHGVGISWPNT